MYITKFIRLCFFLVLATIYTASNLRASEIEFIVPFAPGGPTDQLARAVAQALPASQYQIVYKPGASGRVGVRSMLGRPAMLLAVMPQIFVTNRLMFADLEYDPDRDLEVLAVVAVMPNLLVCNHKTGFKTVKDLMSATRSLNFSASGVGANDHLATAFLLQQWPNRHEVVQYSQGGGNRLTDLLSGVTDCMFASYPLITNHTTDVRLNLVMSSENIGLTVPTWNQQFGVPYPIRSQMAIITSRDLDAAIKQRMRTDIAKVINNSSLPQQLQTAGFVPILQMDVKSINESLRINRYMEDFIVRQQLRLK